jgi:hypothetical protein
MTATNVKRTIRRISLHALGAILDAPAVVVLAAAAVVLVAMLMLAAILSDAATVSDGGVHVLTFNDSHFTGAMVGTSAHAVAIGHGAIHGWILDAGARLDS